MKFFIALFYGIMISNFNNTALHFAVHSENIELIKLLLTCDKLDINIHNILMLELLIAFFYQLFQCYFGILILNRI